MPDHYNKPKNALEKAWDALTGKGAPKQIETGGSHGIAYGVTSKSQSGQSIGDYMKEQRGLKEHEQDSSSHPYTGYAAASAAAPATHVFKKGGEGKPGDFLLDPEIEVLFQIHTQGWDDKKKEALRANLAKIPGALLEWKPKGKKKGKPGSKENPIWADEVPWDEDRPSRDPLINLVPYMGFDKVRGRSNV